MSLRSYRGWCRAAALGLLTAGAAVSQQPPPPQAQLPAPEPTQVPAGTKDYGARPVAYIYGNVPVTRADLAEYLIARGGHDRVEMLVNKMIVEVEARQRGITVTPQEMEAALGDDLKGINVKKEDFCAVVLPKYGKTLYEWMEDVVRPRLLLTKMCKDKVKVTEEEMKVHFERVHGEKRDVRVIIWPSSDDKRTLMKLWNDVRNDDNEFLRLARQQSNPALASVAGHIKPVNKHMIADDKIVETTAFGLKPGEVSQLLETRQGYMVMKLLREIPPETVKFEEVKARLYEEMFDLKLSEQIGKQFQELQARANPTLLLKGPPTTWRFEKGARQLADEMKGGIVPTGGTK